MQDSIQKTLEQVTTEAKETVAKAEKSVQAIKEQCNEASEKAQTIKPELDEKIREVSAQIENFQLETNGKIDGKIKEINAEIENFQMETKVKLDGLSKIITDSVHKAVETSEAKHLSILEEVDGQLDAYKKDIEYKLSQIQVSETDVDSLEKSLKAAMNEVQTRVLRDFNNFTEAQSQKHEEFAKEISEDSNALEVKIKEINSSLDDLKDTAAGNMNIKLQEFQNEINKNLSAQKDEI